MIPLDEARDFVLAGCRPRPPRSVPLEHALGLVLAETVVAAHPLPPFATSAMDGYALRSLDTRAAPATLAVAGTILAGQAPDVAVGPGQAVRIMTGAPMPPGADAVCMVERTRTEDGGATVVIEEAVGAGRAVRTAGEDVAQGEEVFAPGTVLGPGHLGVLASLGSYHVIAHPKPRVGVLSTGDELVESAEPLAPGKIRDANRHSLLAVLQVDGYDTADLGIVGDDLAEITTRIGKAAEECDALVTSGGVSVGDVDYVKAALDTLSAGTMRWMQVAIRPAKPLAFGTIGGTVPVFGLPGNPVSALVSYELFVRPGLRRTSGHAVLDRPRAQGVADEPLVRSPDGKVHLVRVDARFGPDGVVHVRPSGAQESHLLRAMTGSNALAVLPDGGGVGAGGPVEVLLTDTGRMAVAS